MVVVLGRLDRRLLMHEKVDPIAYGVSRFSPRHPWRTPCSTKSPSSGNGSTRKETTVESYMMFAVGLMIAVIAFVGALAVLKDVH
jgi:hypothetical protein